MGILRHRLEQLSRGVVFSRRLPKAFGKRKIVVSPEAGLKYWKWGSAYADQMLLSTAKNEVGKGDVVWDIGANVGLFSLAAMAVAGPQGKCLSMEPDNFLVTLIQRTARTNTDLQIDVLPCAVSNVVGVTYLNIAERARASNFLSDAEGTSQAGGARYQQICPTVDLNFLLAHYEAPHFVKIDVEGAEHLIFEGAERLLTEARPKILTEISAENAPGIYQLLQAHDYQIFHAITKEPNPVSASNILAIPSERTS